MFKKAFVILSFVLLLALGMSLRQLLAQRDYEEEPLGEAYYGEEPLEVDVFEELEALGKKIDQALALLQAMEGKEILKKLDQILKEQASIKEELRIIKIRSSRR